MTALRILGFAFGVILLALVIYGVYVMSLR